MTNDFLPIDLNYGIQRIFRFGITPDETDKNQLINIEKETSASIVKIESLGHSKFVLICNKIFFTNKISKWTSIL